MLKLQIGVVSIPIMITNFSNSRYTNSALHLFSSCCNGKVKMKKVCSTCGKSLTNLEIRKGTDKDTILSDTQQERLKELLENGLMEVIAVQDSIELNEIVPYIQKSQLILPSLSKGMRKTDIKTFFSFREALKEMNKVCIVKMVTRALEHLGLLLILNEDLVFLELPFAHYNNLSEIRRLKQGVSDTLEQEKIINPLEYKIQAREFIKNFKNKVGKIDEAVESKKVLLKQFIKEIREGIEVEEIKEVGIENPFA